MPEIRTCIKCNNSFQTDSTVGSGKHICPDCRLKYSYNHKTVKCEVCGEQLVTLYTHLKTHNMTRKDYIIRFPGKPLCSETFRDVISTGRAKMPHTNMCCKCKAPFKPRESGSYKYCSTCKITVKKKPEGNIECLICHKKLRIINAYHLRTHNTTLADYKKAFPNTPIRDVDVYLKECGECNKYVKKRYKLLKRLGIECRIEGGSLVFGKNGIYYEERISSTWLTNEGFSKEHITRILSQTKRKPSVMCVKDLVRSKKLIDEGYDVFMLTNLLYKLKYKRLQTDKLISL